MSAVADFYEDWNVNKALSNDHKAYWPQARAIVRHFREEALSDGAFGTNVFSWLYSNAMTPWETETEDLFAQSLQKSYDTKNIQGVAPLLRAWTRAGTDLPDKLSHRELIGKFLDSCDSATGTRILVSAPGLTKLLPQAKKQSWLSAKPMSEACRLAWIFLNCYLCIYTEMRSV